MSQEVYTPLVDSYHGTEDSPVDLPEHIVNYGDIRLDPNAPAHEKTAHEAEMSRLWRDNYNLGQLFQSVDSEKFNEAHNQVLINAVNSHLLAQQLVAAMDLKGPAIKKQIVNETMGAIEEEAARQAEMLLPLTEENIADLDNVAFRRVKLIEMLLSDIDVRRDGQAIKRQPRSYQKHLKDWRKFEQLAFATEVELLHHQANLDNSRFNSSLHRRTHQHNYETLDTEYRGLFGRIRDLPIDRYAVQLSNGRTTSLNQVADDFEADRDSVMEKAEVKTIMGKRRAATDKTDRASMVNRLLATKHLDSVSRAVKRAYEAQGISGPALKDIMDKVDYDLKAWLADDETRDDYYLYDISRNGYEMRLKKGSKFLLNRVMRVGNDVYIGLPGVNLRRRRQYGPDMPAAAKDAMKVRPLSSARLTPRAAAVSPKKHRPDKIYVGHGYEPLPPDRI